MKTTLTRIALDFSLAPAIAHSNVLINNSSKKDDHPLNCFPKLLAIIFTFFSFTVQATTYYISPNGSNSSNGDITHPWQTLSYACAHVTNPGDIIHVNAGTYTETAQSNLAVGVSIEGEGSTVSIIKANYAANPLIFAGSGVSNTNGNQSISYLKFDGNARMGDKAIRVLLRGNVKIHHCDFVDLETTAIYLDGDCFYDDPEPVYNVGNEVYNCTFKNCAGYPSWNAANAALKIGGQQDLLIHDNIFTLNTRGVGVGGDGKAIGGAADSWVKGLKIYNNTFIKNPIASGMTDFVMEIWKSRGGLEIYNNRIYGRCDISVTSMVSPYTYGLSFHDNVVGWDSPPANNNTANVGLHLESEMETALVYNNTFKNVTTGIYETTGETGVSHTSNNVTIRNNTIHILSAGGQGYGVSVETGGTASTVSNFHIYNNTIIGSNSPAWGITLPQTGTCDNFRIRNNIINGFAIAPAMGAQDGTLSMTNYYYTNNDAYNCGQTNTYWYFTHGAITENSNIATNPSFVSAPTNIQLNTGSACIDAGINVGLSFNGSAPDIGTFETNSDGSNQPPIINNQSFQLNENTPNGTSIGTVIASDPDAGQMLTYSILSGNTNGAFTINASTGIITVANSSALNFESTPAFALIIKVQDNGSGNLSSQATITASLKDINEAPLISNQSFSINENTANGITVGTVAASDPDASQALSYSITAGNTSNAFTINSSTGKLTVNNSVALNFSVNPKFSLNVRVTDNGTGNLFKEAIITITVSQGSNQAPVIINQGFSINENSANGTTVGTIIATDPDAGQTKTFSILQGNTNGAFTINASTGVLTVANSAALDFEATPTFALIIKVQDNGTGSLSSQATITVSLININEAPVISNQSFSVSENTANGITVGTVAASDPDIGQTLSYSITAGNTSNAFTINSSTGKLTVNNSVALIYSVNPKFSLNIRVMDNGTGNLYKDATITVNVSQGSNQAPVIINQGFSINENSANGTTVGNVIATDPDAGQTKTFSILQGNTNGAFTILASTGVLTVANSAALDFESTPTFALIIKVQDNGTGSLSSQATITVSLIDINEAPVISNQSFSIAENSSVGTAVGTVMEYDPDYGQINTFSIISGNSNGAFAINTSTAVITVANSAALDFETTSSFTLVVKVQDNGYGNLSSQATITVSLIDINEAPVISNQSFSVNENTANGLTVGTVVASDPDASQTLSYSINAGNTSNAFTINSSTGKLTVNNSVALIFNINPKFSLNIRVTDNGTGNLYKDATITVNVSQESNQAPVIINQGFSINENSANGATIGTIIATDPDAGQTKTFSILQGNTNGAFAIIASTGVLTVANSAALDFESTPTFALMIKVQDNGIGSLSSQATITISLIDINEAPVISNQSFSIAENSSVGTAVGTVMEYDPDYGQINTFSIISGNTNSAFTINTLTAVISVANSAALDFETTSSFALIVKAQDNGTGNLSSQATITIKLNDVNEPPVMKNQVLSVVENPSPGTKIGYLEASDPDQGQVVKYMIIGGDESHVFNLNDSTGLLSVADPSKLSYGRNPQFSLTVIAQDNGVGSLSAMSIVTINLLQATKGTFVYIDPTNENDKAQDGSIIHPFNSWNNVTFEDGGTYLQKRGTIFITPASIRIQNKANITLDAYEYGSNPIIFQEQSDTNAIELDNTRNCIIRNFVIMSNIDGTSCINVTGDLSSDLTIENAQLHGALYAIKSSSKINNLKVLNTIISDSRRDGIIANDFGNIEIANCNINAVNQEWVSDPNAKGSCINLSSLNGKVNIHNNELEHSGTGNSAGVSINGTSIEGLIENNILEGGNISGNHCLDLNNSTGIYMVRYNTIKGSETGINVDADTALIYYNQLINNSIAIEVKQNKAAAVMNNTFVGNKTYSIESLSGSTIIAKNNVYYLTPTASNVYNLGGAFSSDFNNFNIEKPGFLNGYSTLASWTSANGMDNNSIIEDPLFESIESGNFRIQSNSPCINKGTETAIVNDFFGMSVPQAGLPDIGFCEVSSDSIQSAEESVLSNADLINESNITVYPNPTADIININLAKYADQQVSIKIINMNGYEIHSSFTTGEQKVTINMENEKPGIYLAVITINGQTITRNIIRT